MNLAHWQKAAGDVGLLAIRIPGFFLAFAHGWGKVSGLLAGRADGFTAAVAALGFPLPGLFAWAAALAECGGGLLVGLGLFARFGAGLAAFTMTVAAFGQHRAHLHLLAWVGLAPASEAQIKAWGNPEAALLYLFPLLGVLLLGAGPLSLDRFLPWGKRRAG